MASIRRCWRMCCCVKWYIFADLIIMVLQALFQGSKIKLVKKNMLYIEWCSLVMNEVARLGSRVGCCKWLLPSEMTTCYLATATYALVHVPFLIVTKRHIIHHTRCSLQQDRPGSKRHQIISTTLPLTLFCRLATVSFNCCSSSMTDDMRTERR